MEELLIIFAHNDFLEAITLNNLVKDFCRGKAIGSNNMDRALLTYSYALKGGYRRSVWMHLEQVEGNQRI